MTTDNQTDNTQAEPKALLSPMKAIRQNCKDCTYDPLAGGTYLQQIEACTITTCALHHLRPLTAETRRKNAALLEQKPLSDAMMAARQKAAERFKAMHENKAGV